MNQNDNASSGNSENLTKGDMGQVIKPTLNQSLDAESIQTTESDLRTSTSENTTIQPGMYQIMTETDIQQSSAYNQQDINNSILKIYDDNAPWFKILAATLLLSVAIRTIHYVFGIIAGLLVFGGTSTIVPLILLFIPNITAIMFLSRTLLGLTKNESIIMAITMTTLYTFGLLNIQVGYDYAALLRGSGNFFGASLGIFTSSLLVWATFILLYLAIYSARTNKRKTALFCGIIFTYLVLIFIYNVRTVRSSFDNVIELESTERYKDITFNPYTVEGAIDNYMIDDRVYITNFSNNITDLKTYYVPPTGKKSGFFSIQQYETRNPLASQQCTDESTGNNKYYTDTLDLECILLYTTSEGHEAYYLKPNQETLQKNAFFVHTVFIVKDGRMIILRAQRIPETRNVEDLMKEIIEKLVQVDKDSFFRVKGLEITTRTLDE